METMYDFLDKLDNLFDSPEKWTKGSYARDKDGKPSQEHSPNTTCFCMVGGVIKVSPYSPHASMASDVGHSVIKLFARMTEQYTFHYWNDAPERTFQDIKDLIKRAKEVCND